MPGLGNSKNDYKALAELLTKEGLTAEIASVNRIDWLRNAAGVVDINYWKGTLNPQPTVNWYLSRNKLSKPHAVKATRICPSPLYTNQPACDTQWQSSSQPASEDNI